MFYIMFTIKTIDNLLLASHQGPYIPQSQYHKFHLIVWFMELSTKTFCSCEHILTARGDAVSD